MINVRRFELTRDSGYHSRSRLRRKIDTIAVSAQDMPELYTKMGNIEGCLQMLSSTKIHPANGQMRVGISEKLQVMDGEICVYSKDGERFVMEVLTAIGQLSAELAEKFPTVEFWFIWKQNVGFGEKAAPLT